MTPFWETKTADAVLDVKHWLCPIPVLRAEKVLRGLKTGQILHITGCSKETIAEFKIWHRGKPQHKIALSEEKNMLWIKK